MTAPDPDLVLALVRAGLASAPEMAGPVVAAQITLRDRGRKAAQVWVEGPLPDSLTTAVHAARAATDVAVFTVEVTLALPARPLQATDLGRAACDRFRGLFGIAVLREGAVQRIGPLEMLTRNLGPSRALEILLQSGPGQALAFPAAQFLIDLPDQRCTRLFRGQPVVEQSTINKEMVTEMAAKMTGWLARQVADNGQTAYKYWPSTGNRSSANNMIRQFMASAALAQAARRDPRLAGACARNFAHNFAAYYKAQPEFGYIVEGSKVKLGAAAVGLIAILHLKDPAPFATQAAGLEAFLTHMQAEDGSFRTFYAPSDRTDCENFYPGEALLALAMLQVRAPTASRLARLLAGFHHYRDWHRAARNPAFVPWHTQASCLLHGLTGQAEIADFVFEMNDWLIGIQAQPGCPPDVPGAFFDPTHPEFGPPHASATGVYLEGLIEAWHLARRLADRTRAETYRRAIVLGLRSLRQLQFRGADDTFYLRHSDRVLGGLRSSGFDNTLRLDNVQHALMAIWRILDGFQPGDFALKTG